DRSRSRPQGLGADAARRLMGEPIYTVGHSNRPIEEILEILGQSGISHLVDVRRQPGSKRYPWFNQDELPTSLEQAGIGHSYSAGLTGRRPASKKVPREINAWWQNRSFHNYADHALSDEFTEALDELRREASKTRLTVMCSEAVWWRCHRRLIADHLLARGD